MAEIIVIGAGLTGLSAAYHLEKPVEKQDFVDIKIFEKNETAGGLLRSVQQDGFTFDYTGHLLHISDPYFYDFLQNIAGINNFNTIERKASIFSHAIFTDYPFQINLHGLPIDIATECIEGYVTRPTITAPKTYYEWMLTHFGAGFGKHFFFPYNSKILSYDLKKVHPAQAGRFVPSTNLQAIIKGTIQKKPPAGIGYNSSFYYPKQGGIQFLINSLCKKIKSPIKIGYKVSHIDPEKKIVTFDNGHQEIYQHLITTMPLNQLLTILKPSARTPLDGAAQKLLCNAVVNLNLGFNTDTLLPMHWVYFPEKSFPLYRLGFWHNICSTSVPPGSSAVYGEFSYLPIKTNHDHVQKMTEQAIKKTLAFLGLSPHHMIIQKILQLELAYIIYNQWHQINVPKILKQLEEWDIYSIGRYGEWKYSSMQEAVLDGKKTAELIKNKQKITQVPLPKKKEFEQSV